MKASFICFIGILLAAGTSAHAAKDDFDGSTNVYDPIELNNQRESRKLLQKGGTKIKPPLVTPTAPDSAECKEAAPAIDNTAPIRYVYVNTSSALQNALTNAASGDVIELAPGEYNPAVSSTKRLTITKSGTSTRPIVICGPPTAVIKEKTSYNGRRLASAGGAPQRQLLQVNDPVPETIRPSGLFLSQVNYVHVYGISIDGPEIGVRLTSAKNCLLKKLKITYISYTGVQCYFCEDTQLVNSEIKKTHRAAIFDYSTRCTMQSLIVAGTGNVGLKLRRNSTHNTISGCTITDTGLSTAGYGEGIEVGSANTNSYYTINGVDVFKPDKSDYNDLSGNTIGPLVRAEMIDVHPHTAGGSIIDNSFDGKHISGDVGADSWVSANGNDYTIRGNTGVNLPSFANGFSTRVVISDPGMPSVGTGYRNIYDGNTLNMTGASSSSYGIQIINYIVANQDNVVLCNNNVVAPAGATLSNVNCDPVGDRSYQLTTTRARSAGDGGDGNFRGPRDPQDWAQMLADDLAERGRDDMPPPGWLERTFPRNDN